jgi:LysM repeat protein
MSAEGQNPLRVLAPASLVVFAIALLIVVAVSLSGGDETSSDEPAATGSGTRQSTSDGTRSRSTARTRQRRFYTVKPGDTLALIAVRQGISLERLRELNQTLDPQGLVSGQKVKLPPPGE